MLGSDPAFRLTGEKRDSASGLYYLSTRHYDFSGRSLQLDPILGSLSAPQTLNRYAYVTNNPEPPTRQVNLILCCLAVQGETTSRWKTTSRGLAQPWRQLAYRASTGEDMRVRLEV